LIQKIISFRLIEHDDGHIVNSIERSGWFRANLDTSLKPKRARSEMKVKPPVPRYQAPESGSPGLLAGPDE
jgi:hypothetical protein